jgi:catalase (peroxidase I)
MVAEPAEPEHPAPALGKSNPMGADFDYAEEFKKLDLDAAVKKDLPR